MGVFSTPRPIPDRRWPAAAGTLVILLALPVFLAAGWGFASWGLAAALWCGGELLAFALGRLPLGLDNLAASGMAGIGMTFRVIAVMVVLIAVAATDEALAVPAALLFIAAYTLELALSLLTYFAGEKAA
ncbi:MAG TPA: hypothetical protein VGQ15_06055 [Gaiellaceae bacterium]|jgi:hypothetical protein|nr:hypothetical protein [Gaiellaceae bacterium]